MLFLNRRGYAPLTLCRACGFVLQCPNARLAGRAPLPAATASAIIAISAMPLPAECPQCTALNSFRRCRARRRAHRRRSARTVSRARASWCCRPICPPSRVGAGAERRRRPAKLDIVIGTQIVAKGHHFPKLNLVGIVDADLGLNNGDPRAAERTFQLLHQVAGRAGRDAGPGLGLLQTHQPEHPVIRALIAQDRKAFYDAEIEVRERTGYPPFGRLASLVISGEDKNDTGSFARALARAAPASDDVRVLGPADAPISLVRGRHRLRLLVKASRNFDLSGYLREWLAEAPKIKGSIKVEIDVDPQSFL